MAVEELRYMVRNAHSTLIPTQSKFVDNRVLAATTNEEVTVATDASVVIITADVDIWVDFNSTLAVIPAADVTDGGGSVLVPAGIPFARVVAGVASFGMIAAGAALISLEWYK